MFVKHVSFLGVIIKWSLLIVQVNSICGCVTGITTDSIWVLISLNLLGSLFFVSYNDSAYVYLSIA